MLEQEERGQAHDLRLAREQPQQQAGQPDRLLAQRRAGAVLGDAHRVALVEDEVDHRRHGGEPFAALDGARRRERHVRGGDARLRARDALLHGGFGDEEGAGNLRDRKPRDDAQRERDLVRRRQPGMAAHEQQPQDVVAVVGLVEAIDQRRLRVGEVGDELLCRQRLLARLPAYAIDGRVLADHDEPGGGIARRTVPRPGLQRAQARLLVGLLRRVEVAKIAQQRCDRLGAGRGERRADPVLRGHVASFPGLK